MMNWKGIGILLSIALAAVSVSIHAQEQQGVLEPETANEARLNRLQPPAQVLDVIGVRHPVW